jgi:CHAT domain-containing protein
VKSELAGIEARFPTVLLQDRTFRTSSVEGAMSRGAYSVVHLATHGYFDSDHSRSFLLTFDGRITMDALQATIGRRKYSEEPLELLVLSACETAGGDDRAALGLAGAGLRAGSRSVVATLWPISDESTAILISNFYSRLQDPKNSKAEALREAQRELLKLDRFRHPFFWAPFLLIGNWL